MQHEEFVLALAVGMNAAAEVARQSGQVTAANIITRYRQDWEQSARLRQRREMERGDIFPPEAERFAIAEDFGFDPKETRA